MMEKLIIHRTTYHLHFSFLFHKIHLLTFHSLKNEIFIYFLDFSLSSFITTKAGNNKIYCQVSDSSQSGTSPRSPDVLSTNPRVRREVASIKWKLLLMTDVQRFWENLKFSEKAQVDWRRYEFEIPCWIEIKPRMSAVPHILISTNNLQD